MALPSGRKLLAIGSFLMLGLSPSFMDWQQSKSASKRVQIVLFYAAAITMFWFGLLK